jgi:hypothetical protein
VRELCGKKNPRLGRVGSFPTSLKLRAISCNFSHAKYGKFENQFCCYRVPAAFGSQSSETTSGTADSCKDRPRVSLKPFGRALGIGSAALRIKIQKVVWEWT